MIGSLAIEQQKKIELDPISMAAWLSQLFAIYGCDRTLLSYVIFAER